MSLKIDRGFFKYDVVDNHAILCVSVDANIKEIRKRYLEIARRLHPDSNAFTSAEEKHLASELLSKLVNPAYEHLSTERSRTEQIIILSHMGKSLAQQSSSVELNGDLAKQLAAAPNIDSFYKTAIAKLAEEQYKTLQKSTKFISRISELNLVYLIRSAANGSGSPGSSAVARGNLATSKSKTGSSTPPPPPPPQKIKEDSAVDHYIRRAENLIEKNKLSEAKVELQDALRLEPKNSHCHSLVALVYLKQNQVKMAKIHFDNALKLDPTDKIALTWKPKIEKALGQQSSDSKVISPPDDGNQPSDQSGGGGLFGGFFGGKKK
ncbi:J domain-containing protein [Nodularia harveyana UHCC-0300]|uniref:J domain-containing protein n=1 Tax=Nodularia harveyana UHCC-0300 TaxID=2974287 RepID=A0ABU5UDV6_9CYAN|nr:J domain-containing protein [Nodularia harveyana]MEA5581712.1 J domain-containing protein [Nodularia harveyana UHCC-0300]